MAKRRGKSKDGSWEYFETGKGGAVYWSKAKQRYELHDKTGKNVRRQYFDDLADANQAAVRLNQVREEFGNAFAALSIPERRAVEMFREFAKEMAIQGLYSRGLDEIVKEALDRETKSALSPAFGEVAEMYQAAIARKGVSVEHLTIVKARLRKVAEAFEGQMIGEIDGYAIQLYIDGLEGRGGRPASAETVNQFRGLISAVFKFAVQRGVVGSNPVTTISKIKLRRGRPSIITPEDLAVILGYVAAREIEYLPVMVIKAFCGLRTAECARLQYSHIGKGGRHEITIDGLIAKNPHTRFVPISDCAWEWLDLAKKGGVDMGRSAFLIPGEKESARINSWSHLQKRISSETGVALPQNVLRHSAASYWCAMTENFPAVASWMGHDLAVLQANYRNAVTKAEGERWFDVRPLPQP